MNNYTKTLDERLLRELYDSGPLGVRPLARRLGRDASNVQKSLQRLVKDGWVFKDADGLYDYAGGGTVDGVGR